MINETRVVIITGSQRRHRFFTEKLSDSLDVVGVVSEVKRPVVAEPERLSSEDSETIRAHFVERDDAEGKLLGEDDRPLAAPVLEVPAGESNTEDTVRWVLNRNPQFVVLYGSSIIKAPLLELFEGRIVNLHLGLSPYYRGSGTNFWPLVHRRPECVGGTIHLATQKVDAGAILMQFRPKPEPADRGHELGTKTIVKGAQFMPQVLEGYMRGTLTPQCQDLSTGQVFFNRDFNAGAVRSAWHNFDTGMMEEYLDQEQRRNSLFPIIDRQAREDDLQAREHQSALLPRSMFSA